MQIGWGEGLDQAARYLNEKPDADRLHVASWYAPGCFSYLFRGSTYGISPQGLRDDDLQNALNADYVVLYTTQQMQRHAALPLLNALLAQEPEYVVQINDIEYARVYRTNPDIDADLTYERVDAVLGQKILLEGFSVSRRSLAPGDTLIVSLSWKVLAAPRERLKVFVHLSDSSGRPVAQHDGEPIAWHGLTDRWRPGEAYADRHGIVLPQDIAAGDYRLLVGMYRYSGQRLPLTVGERQVGDAVELGSISVVPPAEHRASHPPPSSSTLALSGR